MELESELQSLQKANQHLENILEATKAHKRREVSQLHKLHRETLKVWDSVYLKPCILTPVLCENIDFHLYDPLT